MDWGPDAYPLTAAGPRGPGARRPRAGGTQPQLTGLPARNQSPRWVQLHPREQGPVVSAAASAQPPSLNTLHLVASSRPWMQVPETETMASPACSRDDRPPTSSQGRSPPQPSILGIFFCPLSPPLDFLPLPPRTWSQAQMSPASLRKRCMSCPDPRSRLRARGAVH